MARGIEIGQTLRPACARRHTNKLAVVEKDGAGYAKHVDNMFGACGADENDARKVTAIYYLNPDWDAQRGGFLRAYDADVCAADDGRPQTLLGDLSAVKRRLAASLTDAEDASRIAPRGDRLVIFWSNALVHDVEPSSIIAETDRRWALTTWLVAQDPDNDPSLSRGLDAEAWARHFNSGPSGDPATRFARAAAEKGRTELFKMLRRLSDTDR